jgi:uncharacterized protein (DUF488 family)
MKQFADITIYTIGHSTRSLDAFTDLLSKNHIEVVADVRSLPGSRKFPQFNAEALEVSLPEHGIEYIPFKQLGGRRKVRSDSPHTVWRHKAFRGYADYMDTEDFENGIETLITLARTKRTAIMCAEAAWWRCHRSLVSDYLKARGWTVMHIMGIGKSEEHRYTSPAKIIGNEILYSKEQLTIKI